MKKVIATISLSAFVLCLFSFPATAQKNAKSKLEKQINTFLSYPYLSAENMEGEVNVSFWINEEGKIEVSTIDASNASLIPYVLRRLEKVTIPLDDATIGSNQSLSFSFVKEDGIAAL